MNNELIQFLSGDRLAIKLDEVIVTQEIFPNGYRLTRIQYMDSFMYEFICDGKFTPTVKTKRKSTGGKPSYAKVYIQYLSDLKNQNINPYLVGCMVWLVSDIQWGKDGLITKGKGKSRKPVNFEDFMQYFNTGRTKTAETIRQLKESSLLIHDEIGYKANTSFIQKGGG